MLNRVHLVGHLTDEPKLIQTKLSSYIEFHIQTLYRWFDENGNAKKRVEKIPISVKSPRARKFAQTQLRKDMAVAIDAELRDKIIYTQEGKRLQVCYVSVGDHGSLRHFRDSAEATS